MTAITAVLIAALAIAFALWLNTKSGKKWNNML